MADRFLIAPYDSESSQTSDVKPWLIPDRAFAELRNVYQYRGRIRKRFGTEWFANQELKSRLRINLGDTDKFGVFAGVIGIALAVGQLVSVGDTKFTVNTLIPSAGTTIDLLSTTLETASYDTATLILTVHSFSGSTPVYFYPALPVMGLLTAETDIINDEFLVGFDTKFAYYYNDGWERLALEAVPGDSEWYGSNSQFFWGTTWSGASPTDNLFFVTNNNQLEPNYMRYLTPTDNTGMWYTFRPALDSGLTAYLDSARILVVFHGHLVALNTWENEAGLLRHYVNRARYSQIGSPIQADAWYSTPGKGNAIDAATKEAIITAEFVKDRLIVYFERSTWELAYTGNQVYPFTWYQINPELGAESTHSIVPFDKVCLGVGNVGIMACNGANVERIDSKIPEEVFNIHNIDQGLNRVYGIRDYFTETMYWSFPSVTASTVQPFCNRVLVYNYKTGTWALNDDSITCFGYYNYTSSADKGITWDSTLITWDDTVSWGGGEAAAKFRAVVAGNQEGYTFICSPSVKTNAAVLQITDISAALNIVTVTAINHNLRVDEFVYITGIVDSHNLALLNDSIFKITGIIDADNFTFSYSEDTILVTPGYQGGGLLARVSKISIKTKQFNFYNASGRNAYIKKIEFLVDRTAFGQIQVHAFASSSVIDLVSDGMGTGTLLGTSTLDTYGYNTNALIPSTVAPIEFEALAERIWHPVYFQAEGNVVQFSIELNDLQMSNTKIRQEDFQMHAMMIICQPTTYSFM